jgi:Tol biopolymer transport system component
VDFLLDLETGRTTPLPASVRVETRSGRNGYTVSPDGSEVAYSAPSGGRNQVFVAHLDGTHARQITHGVRANLPAWSPDGARIAYVGGPDRDLNDNVFIIDLKSGVTTQVTHERVPVSDARFSPNGSAIVYTASEPRGEEVRIVPVTGGKGSRLVGGPGVPASGASFSADGSLMSYACGGEGLCVADADGSDRRMIARARGIGWIPSASWSPTGSRLAYWSFFTDVGVYVYDVATGETTRVADRARSGHTLAWPQWVDDHTLVIEIYLGGVH